MRRIRRIPWTLYIALLVGLGVACASDKSRESDTKATEAEAAASRSEYAAGQAAPKPGEMQLRQLRALGYLDGGGTASYALPSGAYNEFPDPDWNTERYDFVEEGGFLSPAAHPLSTFSIDVDTASYSNVRRFLEEGQLPPRGAVRIEELVNYFRYDRDFQPDGHPFALSTELTQAPWADGHLLLRVGLRAVEVRREESLSSLGGSRPRL